LIPASTTHRLLRLPRVGPPRTSRPRNAQSLHQSPLPPHSNFSVWPSLSSPSPRADPCPRSSDVEYRVLSFRAPNRNTISYLVSHFAMLPVFRSPPSCSFSLHRARLSLSLGHHLSILSCLPLFFSPPLCTQLYPQI
jgi:hypothetical protein